MSIISSFINAIHVKSHNIEIKTALHISHFRQVYVQGSEVNPQKIFHVHGPNYAHKFTTLHAETFTCPMLPLLLKPERRGSCVTILSVCVPISALEQI